MNQRNDKGQRHGPWKWYYNNKTKLECQGEYVNDTLHGFWKWYYDNGQLDFIGKYRMGLEIGIWKYFWEDGQLHYLEFYL